MEGRLGRLLGRSKRSDLRQDVSSMKIRADENRRTLYFNADRFNNAVEVLSAEDFSDEAGGAIRSAITSAVSVQRAKDEIYWREALLSLGYSLKEINAISEQKDEIELQVDIEAPIFESTPQDPNS